MADLHWQPTASLANLEARARLLSDIRRFFADRQVLEVDTPLVAPCTVTDPHIESIALAEGGFLQTSPEYFMKRLLASGVPDCYQLGKVFRADEKGRKHNPEFTLLEWYRVGFDLEQLMQEVETLMHVLLGTGACEYLSYQAAFESRLGFDPLSCRLETARQAASRHMDLDMKEAPLDDWLHALMSHVIEPSLGMDAPVFLYDYPKSQASLACTRENDRGQEVAARFELYFKGLELANGFHELTDQTTQRARFDADNVSRTEAGLSTMTLDEAFLAALPTLPACSGVAIGIDRLLMLKCQADSIEQVISFR